MTLVNDLANKLAKEGRASEIERELEKLDPAKLRGRRARGVVAHLWD